MTGDGTDPQMALIIDGSERATWSVAAGESYTPYFARTPLTGDDVFEVCYTNDNAARELWVDAVMVGGPAPLPYHASLPAVRHAAGTPQPVPPPAGEGVTIQAEGGAMLYGRGSFQAPDVVPGRERLDEGGALRFVVGVGAFAAEYDPNGNMTSRVVAEQAQILDWDAENRLVGIRQGASISSFVYDADGNRVLATVDGVSTVYIGGYYEETAGAARTYYYHAGQRVAMREAGVTTWLLSDHLGSTNVAYAEASAETISQGYYAWGTIRPGPENELPTDYTYTGQRLDERSGLLYYVARWYDGFVGRFLSADSIVPEPGNPQSLNRFAYAGNNPLRYSDPTGHMCDPGGAYGGLDPRPKPPVPEDPIPEPDIPDDPIPEPRLPKDPIPEPRLPKDPAPITQLRQTLGGDLIAHIGDQHPVQVWAWDLLGYYLQEMSLATAPFIYLHPNLLAPVRPRPGPDGTLVIINGALPPDVGGFTVGEVIVLARDDRFLLEHEYVHVLQYRQLGPAFAGAYVQGGFYDWQGNPLEAQAMAVQRLYEANASLPSVWMLPH